MNKFLRTYLPAFSMAFTFIILYATISNIIAGYSKDRFCFFILQVSVYLMVSVIADWLLSFIDFSKYIYHFIAEMIILYPITIGVAFIGKNDIRTTISRGWWHRGSALGLSSDILCIQCLISLICLFSLFQIYNNINFKFPVFI